MHREDIKDEEYAPRTMGATIAVGLGAFFR